MRSLLVLALAGCTTYLPPPAPPSLRLPPVALPDERPPAGFGRLVIDTTRAPARVDEIVGEGDFCYRRHCRSVTITHNLGTTPCVVDLPYGVHDLELTSLTDEHEHEHDRVRYRFPSGETHGYLRTLGHHEPVSAQASAGVALLGLGAALALGALAAGISGAQTSGLGLGVSGAGLLLVGIPVAATARSVERPGSATWWRIEP